MADKVYKLIFTKDDGSEDVVQFTAPQGEPGEPGRDGQPGTNGKDGTDGKDYTLTDADKQEIAELTAPLVDIPSGGGGSGGGYGDYEVLIDEIITTDGAGISTIRYTELDFSKYNDIVIVFDRASNKANSGQDIKVSIRMLGHTLIYNQSIANPVDSYRSCFYRVLNMGNGNVASFASTSNNQNNNPSQLNCCGIFPLNGAYQAEYDNGFSLDLSQAYIGTINIKILAK